MEKNVRRAAGFTLVELLVVIGIIALLISILLPTLAKARDAAYTTKCMATMHSLGESFAAYQTAYGTYPPGLYLVNSSATGNASNVSDTNQFVYTWWSIIRGFMRIGGTMDNSISGQVSGTSITRFMEAFSCPLGHNPTAGCDFGANPVIMPDENWETFYKASYNPILGPARPTGVYPDNVVLWDATEIPPDYSTQFVVGYGVDSSSSGSMMTPNYPGHRFRDVNNVYNPNSQPLLSDGNPIYVYTDSPPASTTPPPLFAEGVSAASTSEQALAVPCWRHDSNSGCNFLYCDGSVKTLHIKWTSATSPTKTPWQCELLRRQLRIKWPAGFVNKNIGR